MHILCVTFCSLLVLHLQLDIVDPLLLNAASLLLLLMIGHSD